MSVKLGINEKSIINQDVTVSQIVFGVPWKEKEDMPFDLIVDLLMFGLNEEDKCIDNRDIFFFFNPELSTQRETIIKHHKEQEVIRNNGRQERDTEQIFILLDEVPLRYKKLLFCAVVYEDEDNDPELDYNLSKILDLNPHIFNFETGDPIVTHEPYSPNFFLRETCMILGSLERDEENIWTYQNISQAFLGNIGTLLGIYLQDKEPTEDKKESKEDRKYTQETQDTQQQPQQTTTTNNHNHNK